jgi:hypothetical protein
MSRPSTPTLAASAVALALGAALAVSNLTGTEQAQAAPKHLAVPVAMSACAPARPPVITVRIVQPTARTVRPAPRHHVRLVARATVRPVIVQRVTIVNRVSASASAVTSRPAPVVAPTPAPVVKGDDDDKRDAKDHDKKKRKHGHGKKHCKKHRHH